MICIKYYNIIFYAYHVRLINDKIASCILIFLQDAHKILQDAHSNLHDKIKAL
jgi:hypothetical protein